MILPLVIRIMEFQQEQLLKIYLMIGLVHFVR